MNPELRRNLWLEFSLHRMIIVPVVIALVALLIVATNKSAALESIAGAAGMGFIAIVMLWGVQLAGGSVTEEARARTWDSQRMSAIGPWAMTWGKLFGAPSFTWYGGAMLLPIFVVAGWNTMKMPVFEVALLMIAAAVLLHATALNASVLAARKGMAQRHGSAFSILIMFFMLFAVVMPIVNLVSELARTTQWWRWQFYSVDFVLGSVVAFGAWAVLGAYRSMCNELEIRTTPWAVPAFLVFTAAYLAGFSGRGDMSDIKGYVVVLLWGVAVSSAAVYLLLFAEQSGVSVWQRLLTRLRGGQWHRALQEMPVWLVALVTALVFALMVLPFRQTEGPAHFLRNIGFAPLAIVLFALRDAAIFQFFSLARQPRRVEAATLFYLALLYWLIPGLLSAAGANMLAELFWPPLLERPGFATAVIAIHAGIAIGLAGWRWQRVHAPDTDTPQHVK